MDAALALRVRWADVKLDDADGAGLTMSRRTDREAEFEAFFVAHYDAITDSVAYVCGDRARAEDATQEAFIKAYAAWNKVRRYDNTGAWVRRVAINSTRDTHRSDTRRNRREERAASSAPRVGADPPSGDAARDLLTGLPDRQRAIAALYYLDDMSVAEISAVLGIASGTVRSHLSEARARLREHLDRSHDRAV